MIKCLNLIPGKELKVYGTVHFGSVYIYGAKLARIYDYVNPVKHRKTVLVSLFDDKGNRLASADTFTKVEYSTAGLARGTLFFI